MESGKGSGFVLCMSRKATQAQVKEWKKLVRDLEKRTAKKQISNGGDTTEEKER